MTPDVARFRCSFNLNRTFISTGKIPPLCGSGAEILHNKIAPSSVVLYKYDNGVVFC